MDEEKTIDEAVEEQADEMKEFEPVAFDEVIKETEPERKDAPILRDAPEPADMNMIHKHVDNFLAKIAGETPIDENVRDSTEYWLDRIGAIGGVSNIMKMTKLWENDSPNSSFAAGKVSIDLSGYDFVYISYRASVGSSLYSSTMAEIDEHDHDMCCTASTLLARRNATVLSDGIIFSGGFYVEYATITSGVTQSNQYILPIAIYGIKIV